MRICFAFTFPNNRKSGGMAVEFQGPRPDFSPSPARPSSALRRGSLVVTVVTRRLRSLRVLSAVASFASLDHSPESSSGRVLREQLSKRTNRLHLVLA